MPKAKVSVTIAKELVDEVDGYFRKLVVDAAKSGKPIPKISNVYEEIVARGWAAIKGRKTG